MSPAVESQSRVERALVECLLDVPGSVSRLPVELLTRSEKALALERLVAERARLAAYEAELVCGLADESPDGEDPPAGARGSRAGWSAERALPGISEFFPAELGLVLNCGRGTAANLAIRAWTWRTNLPGTFAALAAGELDEPRAKLLAEVLEHADPGVSRRVEAALLPEAADLSLRRLRERAAGLLLEYAPKQAEKARQEAEKAADVRIYPSTREGMATVAVDLPADEAAAAYSVIDQLARLARADGDPRPIGQLRTRMWLATVLRFWHPDLPPVTANLQITASLSALEGASDQAGEVSGLVVTGAHLRQLLHRLDALGLRAPAGGSVTLGLTDDDGALLATCTLDQLRAFARRGCPDHRDQDCSCAVLGRPERVDGYTPSRPQQRFVHTRDRTCRFPTCGQRVGWADADHVVPHACGGETDCANLCCLCRSHHRLKTFAQGWQFALADDGTLTVTTPSGITRSTRPPGLRPPDPPDPPDDPDTGGAAAGGPEPGPRPRAPGIRELIRRSRIGPDSPPLDHGSDPPPY
ncbi:HNH endonuclease signature motif containing protein [Trujillonella humicola]|uniref:HNH endonuclease signature motif containing protein n=1 Tax=Trujillonella humicola TaxID=3383699 RepID=UPI003905D988